MTTIFSRLSLGALACVCLLVLPGCEAPNINVNITSVPPGQHRPAKPERFADQPRQVIVLFEEWDACNPSVSVARRLARQYYGYVRARTCWQGALSGKVIATLQYRPRLGDLLVCSRHRSYGSRRRFSKPVYFCKLD